jgi:branched-chain amino acid transport system ATP-binding protein
MVILEAEKLTKRFGGLVAVQDFDLTVRRGDLAGLIGPNGAGKTTVFNLLACFFPPDGGRIVFRGKDIRGLRPHQAALLGVARTFQVTRPFVDNTVLENVMVGAFCRVRRTREAEAAARRALDLVEFGHRADVVGHELTVAERKRLEVARALATRPELLLLDEPMAGLNATERGHLVELLRRIRDRHGVTMILVEHDMKAVMSLCERVVVLHRGQKLIEGTPAEVARDPAAITAYLGEGYAAS